MNKYSLIIPVVVTVGVIIAVLSFVFYYFLAQDIKKHQRLQEMHTCIDNTQARYPQKIWSITDEGKACIVKYQDVWLEK